MATRPWCLTEGARGAARRVRWSCGTIAVFCCAGFAAHAQEPVVELSPYEVRAWHFERADLDIPADIVAIESDALAAYAGRSLPEALSSLANVHFRSFNGQGNEGQLSMRGFGENSGLRVLVLVDGQRLNPADMGGIQWDQYPVENIARVEVLRGGQAVLYGQHSFAGVIKIQTKAGAAGGRLRLEVGTESALQASVHHGWQVSEGRHLSAGIQHQSQDGYRDNAATRARSAQLEYRQDNRDGGGQLVLRAVVGNGYTEYPGPLTWEAYLENPRQSLNGGNQYGRTDHQRVTFNYGAARSAAHRWQLDSSAYNRRLEIALDGTYADKQQYGMELHPRLQWGTAGRTVIGGVDLQADWLDFIDYLNAARQTVQADAALERTAAGAYLYAERDSGERFGLSGGLRYDRTWIDAEYAPYVRGQLLPEIVDNRGTRPNPDYKSPPDIDTAKAYAQTVQQAGWTAEIGLNYRLTEHSSVWLGAERIRRYPVLDEIAAFQGYELSAPFNADLQPESGWGADVGWKYRSGRFSGSVSGYLLRVDNEIAFDEQLGLNTNLAPTRRTGMDIELRWQATHWAARTVLAWVKAEFDEGPYAGARVPLVPEIRSVNAIEWRPTPAYRIELAHTFLDSQYQGGDYSNSSTAPGIPQAHLFDLTFEAECAGNSQLRIAIQNVLDRQYILSAYSGGYYPGNGRSLRVAWSTAF